MTARLFDEGPRSERSLDTVADVRFGTAFVMRSGFDPSLVEAVQASFARPRFERADKSWRVPLSERDTMRVFARHHELTLTDAARAALEGREAPEKATIGKVELDALEGELLMKFAYSRRLVEELKVRFPTRRFDSDAAAWRVPLHHVREVRRFAADHGLACTPDVESAPDADPERLPITVTERGDHLVLRFESRGLLSDAVRALPGSRWSQEKRAWFLPAEGASSLLGLLRRCGVDVGAASSGWLATAQSLLDRVERSRALDADIELPASFAMVPYPFQRAGIAYAVEARRCLIGDDMGLGKTVQALGVLAITKCFPAVVICPASVKRNWQREIRRAMPELQVVVLSGTNAPTSFGFMRPDVAVVNYDIVGCWQEALADLAPRAVIADECHLAKNAEAQRTIAAVAVASLVPPDGVVLGLTGTPVLNRREEMASQLNLIGRLEEFGTSGTIAKRDDLARALRARCMVRRLKGDVLPELPPRTYVRVPTEGEDRYVRVYRRVEREFLAWLREWALEQAALAQVEDPHSEAMSRVVRARSAQALVRIGFLRRAAVRCKIAAARTWVKEFLLTGRKLLVFGEHLELCLHPLREALGAAIIEGATPPERRQDIVDRFQNDEDQRLLLCSMKAAGVGLTLTAASDALFVELPWSPSILDQALDRTYGRLDNLHGATGYELVLEREDGDTIDQRMLALIEEKREEVTEALDATGTDKAAGGSILADLLVGYVEDAL